MKPQVEWIDVEQNTDEWLGLRAARVTGSGAARIMANFGKAFGEPAKNYAKQIAVESLTGKACRGGFSSEHTERGHEDEPIAVMKYEEAMFCKVLHGGFYAGEKIGTSPDGRVGENGLIEVKSALAHIHAGRVDRGSYDPAYKWQYAWNLKVSGRDWLDFVSYCADYPEGKQLYIYRCYAGEFAKEFEMIDERLEQFFDLVEMRKKALNESKYIRIAA